MFHLRQCLPVFQPLDEKESIMSASTLSGSRRRNLFILLGTSRNRIERFEPKGASEQVVNGCLEREIRPLGVA